MLGRKRTKWGWSTSGEIGSEKRCCYGDLKDESVCISSGKMFRKYREVGETGGHFGFMCVEEI